MDRKLSPDELLSQVNQFWGMLDDMVENSPESYQKFIQQHMKEGQELLVPPEPHLCFQTKILDPGERLLFINICKWKRVPAPKSDADPVPLVAGTFQEVSEGTVADIAYSPEILKRADCDPVEQDQLIRLAMKYIEQQHKVTLCHSYHIAPFKLKGNLQQMRNRLEGRPKKPTNTKKKTEGVADRPLLDQLKNIAVTGKEEEPTLPIHITKDTNSRPVKAGLIEVISTTELDEEDLLSPPQHELSVTKDESGKPHKVILTAELQGVRSVSGCDLSVSKKDLMLEVPGRYKLHLDLPEVVNEETVTAKYNKANKTLTVTMFVL
ncbi:PIH1 domain-containing protein 2 [Pseudophryne corroboree]|uniref:PIH1 domain-containing protein 2 n=1 Tax=Pseudophryne corroboree TaxID=495146 RepID=UPI0030817DCA